MNEIRKVTRREQLEWLLNFLYEERERLNQDIEATQMELKLEREKENE